MSNREEQKRINREALLEPKPGDYWEERLVGVLVVLSIVPANDYYPELIVVCDTRKDVDLHGWFWDTEETKRPYKVYDRKGFMKTLGMSEFDLSQGIAQPWGDVHREIHLKYIDLFPKERIEAAVARYRATHAPVHMNYKRFNVRDRLRVFNGRQSDSKEMSTHITTR